MNFKPNLFQRQFFDILSIYMYVQIWVLVQEINLCTYHLTTTPAKLHNPKRNNYKHFFYILADLFFMISRIMGLLNTGKFRSLKRVSLVSFLEFVTKFFL